MNSYQDFGEINIPNISDIFTCEQMCYYSPDKQGKQSFVTSEPEGHVTGNINREYRKRISPLNSNDISGAQGQIRTKFGKSQFLGSGSLCLGTNRNFIITCAHNFVQILKGINDKHEYVESAFFFYSQDGYKKYDIKLKITSFRIFPGYFENHNIHHGFDLAIGFLEPNNRIFPSAVNGFYTEKETFTIGTQIMVMGYPGEKDGYLYSMNGSINSMVKKDGYETVITYSDLNTSGGQSGSPVYKIRNNNYFLIGIHVGYDRSANANVGTALTQSKWNWINSTVESGSRITLNGYNLQNRQFYDKVNLYIFVIKYLLLMFNFVFLIINFYYLFIFNINHIKYI